MSEVCRNAVEETCLVESLNSSLRNKLAMFHRRTKASARSFDSLNNAVFLWVNGNTFLNNIEKYANFGRMIETKTIEEKEEIKKNNKIKNKEKLKIKVNKNTKGRRKTGVA